MRSFWIIWILTCSACVATDVGNPQTDDVDVEVRLEAFEESMPNALMLDDGIELTHAWIATDMIRLEPCEVEEEEEESDIEFDVPTVTDLLTSTSFPEPPRLQRSLVDFCGFEFRSRPLSAAELPVGAPEDLADVSMLVRGRRKDGNPFVIRAEFDESFELDGDVSLRASGLNRLVLGFAVNGWMTQRDLAPLTGNPIIVDPLTNTDAYGAFEEAVKSSARLFEDQIESGGAVAR